MFEFVVVSTILLSLWVYKIYGIFIFGCFYRHISCTCTIIEVLPALEKLQLKTTCTSQQMQRAKPIHNIPYNLFSGFWLLGMLTFFSPYVILSYACKSDICTLVFEKQGPQGTSIANALEEIKNYFT